MFMKLYSGTAISVSTLEATFPSAIQTHVGRTGTGGVWEPSAEVDILA
jgi:hypothetical protein